MLTKFCNALKHIHTSFIVEMCIKQKKKTKEESNDRRLAQAQTREMCCCQTSGTLGKCTAARHLALAQTREMCCCQTSGNSKSSVILMLPDA